VKVVGLIVLASALQGGGTVLQKSRVATRAGGIPLREVARGLRRFFAPLVRDPLWVFGHVLTVCGAMVGVQAFSMADLTVVKSLGRLEIPFIVLAGALLLGERLTWREGLGLALTALGGTFLAASAGTPTGIPTTTATYLAFIAGIAGLVAVIGLVQSRIPTRVKPELGLAVTAGLMFGTSDVLLKGATACVMADGGGFSILDTSSMAALASTPELAFALVAYVGGLIVVQAAYSVGRVSFIGPALGLSGSLLPILFGVGVLRESVRGDRLAAIAVMLVGAAFLTTRASAPGGEGEPPAPSV
jgi:drug/metabolite transporter (DMT)-like permease